MLIVYTTNYSFHQNNWNPTLNNSALYVHTCNWQSQSFINEIPAGNLAISAALFTTCQNNNIPISVHELCSYFRTSDINKNIYIMQLAVSGKKQQTVMICLLQVHVYDKPLSIGGVTVLHGFSSKYAIHTNGINFTH